MNWVKFWPSGCSWRSVPARLSASSWHWWVFHWSTAALHPPSPPPWCPETTRPPEEDRTQSETLQRHVVSMFGVKLELRSLQSVQHTFSRKSVIRSGCLCSKEKLWKPFFLSFLSCSSGKEADLTMNTLVKFWVRWWISCLCQMVDQLFAPPEFQPKRIMRPVWKASSRVSSCV